MRFQSPKGWKRQSDSVFIHPQIGASLERRIYRGNDGWFLIPRDLDQQVLGFPPTRQGRDEAFAAFAEGRLNPARKTKVVLPTGESKPRRGRKPRPRPEGVAEPGVDEG